MRSKSLKALLRTAALAGALITAGSSPALAVDVYLAARPFTKPLPGAADPTPMWGFAACDSDFTTNCVGPDAPGAKITAAAGDTLNVHLKNDLAVPVSLVIPGQVGGGLGTPVPDPVTGRVRSFGQEVAAAGTADFTFTDLRAGTYLYQSGTLPSIQVPMGLYGALIVTGGTYPAADVDQLVLFSEIDPVQNAAVQAFVDGTATNYPSTINYKPQYFLVNGAPYNTTTPPAPIEAGDGSAARTLLLRLANAGLRSHAANIVGLDMTVRAEDGNVYPSEKTHSSTLLPAGKTLDATVALPAGNRTFPVYDRMLDLTNANQPGGGLLAYLQTGTGSPTTPPTAVAVNDTYPVIEDTPLAVGAPGVLGNDTGLSGATAVTPPVNGTLVLNPDGSFTYTPNPDYSGPDSFVYSASDGTNTYSAQVALAVSFANDAPVGTADSYTNSVGTTITVAAPGVLGNDIDADGDTLTATIVTGLAGLTLNDDGSFSYSGAAGTQIFTYNVSDGTTTTGPVTVTLTRNAPNGPALAVLGPNNEAVTAYRWVLEQDLGFHPDPTLNQQQQLQQSLGTNFHRSYMPVVAQGCMGAPTEWCPVNRPLTDAVVNRNSHYFVSVLPANAGTETGYTLGAAPIPPRVQGQPYAVTVRVNSAPVPTAQIHVWVFEDNAPVNGTPDGEEPGLGGFQIILEDGGGRYGISAGAMMFDAFGAPVRNSLDCFGGTPPADIVLTCPDTPANQAAGLVGRALIKNLAPAKYGVQAVPPAGAASKWSQTSTIEGKKVIDAWVKAGEPVFFQEFGPPGYHVFIGFVSPERVAIPPTPGTNAVSGSVTNLHMSRPPDQTLYDSDSRDALAHTTAWVALNSAAGLGPAIAVAKADADTNAFSLTGIPDGSYQLVVWDDYLDQIIAFRNVTVAGGAGGDLGNVPVFQWFSRLEHHVFHDANENGIRDAGEEGMPDQNVNLRFRDGSLYQAAPTDTTGYVPFDETFPFFHWLVAEVDFARHKATGVTVTVDGGGDVTSTGGVLNPQVQLPADGGGTSRTETGPVLLQAFQAFLGQTSVLQWGKKPYAPGENGGISGIVYYSITRAEDDPRLGVGDPWEPGIPGVTVRLYREVTRENGSKGLVFVAETVSDSWDASQPTGCPGAHPTDPVNPPTRCYDGLRNFNQVRPGVFDGGYAFADIPPGRYVVEMIPPPGYEVVKEEDKNVVFGDVFTPAALMLPGAASIAILPNEATVAAALAPEPGLLQPECVGPAHIVSPYLSLLPDIMELAPFAGEPRPLCNRKLVILNDRANGVADFHLFTAAPIAGHGVGMILDDTAQEFNPNSPQFGEKWAPPFVPVSFRDWTGREISRVLSDQWGRFNALVPSTYNANEPMFSGMSPSMMISCMNDPGPIPGPGGALITDPQYNPVYGTFCYTLQYMPGTTTYLDTPVVPTAAFAAGYPGVDCAYPNGTPMVKQVNGTGIGPWVSGGGQTLTILAQGLTDVPNPAYLGPEGPPGQIQPKTIQRDYGFGASQGTGLVKLGEMTLAVTSWSNTQITATVPAGTPMGSYQLAVTRGNGRSTMNAITVHVGGPAPVHVTAPGAASDPIGPIQAAIDAATAGQLIIVDPGTYPELVIMTKPVRLQGAGPGVTFLNAAKVPTQKLDNWRNKLNEELGASLGSGNVDLLPPQELGAAGVEPDTLNTEQGAGITVMGRSDTRCATPDDHCFGLSAARIDGFTLTAGDSAGAIYVNGWVHGLQISNNIVKGNSGLFHGGIRVGVPYMQGLEAIDPDGPYGFNRDVRIHHNQITHNGGLGGAGGGLMLCTGTDGYQVTENWVCGNFTQGDGAGIAHFGLSNNGTIARNQILFNQSFNQGLNVHGGGLFIAGEPDPAGALGLGAGNVSVDANLILGNQAGAGHGGGIRTQFVNGVDAGGTPHQVTITNNMIANNVAGWAGGGLSLQDTIAATVRNNTVARNDSTATVGATFTAGPNTSAYQPAGIVSEAHSPALAAAVNPDYSNPTAFNNNIIWENRSFFYTVNAQGVGSLQPALTPSATGACDGGTPNYWDLGVLGGGSLTPASSILTPANPSFLASYCNTARTMRRVPGVTTLQAVPALDEGGNWIEVRYGPITLTRGNDLNFFGNYHISGTSAAINNGTAPAPASDYDGQTRTAPPDIGADEVPGTVAFTSATLGTLTPTTGGGTLAFGNRNGLVSSIVTVTVSGGAPVTFGTLTLTNIVGTALSIAAGTDTCSGATRSPGQTCTVTINFNAPSGNSNRTGTLAVPHNGGGSPSPLILGLSGS